MGIKALVRKYGIKRTLQKGIGGVFYRICKPFVQLFVRKFRPVIDKNVLFLSKPSFSDNSKALYLYMVKNHPDYNYIWLIDNDLEMPISNCSNLSFFYAKSNWHTGYPLNTIRAIMTCKYIFFTHNSPVENLPKRQEQFVVNLWHGCGYKDQIKREYAWNEKKKCDIALVPGPVFVETKSKCWGVGSDIIKPLGYPRYDMLINENDHAKKYADSLKGNNRLLIIWMPTFRQSLAADYPEAHLDKVYDLPLLSSDDDLILLNRICEEKQISLCIKRHPSQAKYHGEALHFSNIIFIDNTSLVNAGVELYEMIRYTDALISDYSSVSVDYLLLNRSIAFALDDYLQYQSARGFVFDDPLKYMPGHHLYEINDMIRFFDDVCSGNDCYADKRIEMMPVMHNLCDNYCERIWNSIVRLSAEKENKGM